MKNKVLRYISIYRDSLRSVWSRGFTPCEAKMCVLGIVAKGVCTSVRTVEKSLRAYGFEHDLWHMEDIIANLLEEDSDV